MNKLFNLSLMVVSIFLASCSNSSNNKGEEIKQYNVVYKFLDDNPDATEKPTVIGPNTIKSNEEALITLTYNDPTAPIAQEDAISSFDNISVKDYIKNDDYIATFKIYDAHGEVAITFFKYFPQPPVTF